MIYYFINCHDDKQTFKDFTECRNAAKKDGSVGKFRDTQGGEYFL